MNIPAVGLGKRMWLPVLLAGCLGATVPVARAQQGRIDPVNDKYAVFWTGLFHHGIYMHLGPTGLWGWVDGNRAYVVFVERGSPADGLIHAPAVIIGAMGRLFPEGQDARVHLGNAITQAESTAGAGRLELMVLQDGRRGSVTLRLAVMGDYAGNWPFDCAKSSRIVDQACAYLADMQLADGHFPSDSEIGQPWAGLLLLASGRAEYLEPARRAAYWIADHPYEGGLFTWTWGYRCVFLSEYYLATGDRNVLPALQDLVRRIQSVQAECGSWGHGIASGYGTVNATGLICFMGLILARECGVEVDRQVLDRSIAMFQRYAGKGHIPYGDHPPRRSGTGAGNGKTAMAAVAFKLLGGYDRQVRDLVHTVAESYPYVEQGHTGCYFSFFWNSIAVADAPVEQARRFWDHWRWYYELSRHWRGGMVSQPMPGFGEPGMKYQNLGIPATTGGLAMFYALPRRSLRILGAPSSVFAADAPALFDKARTLYDRHDWPALQAELNRLLQRPDLPAEARGMARQMQAAAERLRRSVALTLDQIRAIGQSFEGRQYDLFRCAELGRNLKRFLGDRAGDLAELAELDKACQDNAWLLDRGRQYNQLLAQVQAVAGQSWHYYGRRMKADLQQRLPLLPESRWKTVLPLTDKDHPRQWRWFGWDSDAMTDQQVEAQWKKLAGWTQDDFDDSTWKLSPGPVTRQAPAGRRKKAGPANVPWANQHLLARIAFTHDGTPYRQWRLRLGLSARQVRAMVYLNGCKIATIYRDTSKVGRYDLLPLSPRLGQLLRKGRNVLAVYAWSEGRGSWLNVGLDGRP